MELFKNHTTESPRLLWKILPVAFLIMGGAVAALIFLSPDSKEAPPLTGVIRSEDPEFELHRNDIRLESDKVQMSKNFAGHRMIIFSGILENRGDRSVDVVEVRLTLFNYEEPVLEVVRTPVRPGTYTPPIPPFESRRLTLYLEEIPEDWRASHAEMALHGFRFKP